MPLVQILCYIDATDANLKCGSSQGVYLICLYENGNMIPVVWQSYKVSRVTKSLHVSETLVLNEGADAVYLLATQIRKIFLLNHIPQIRHITDNKPFFDTLKTSSVTKDLPLRVDVARLREMEENSEISVSWINSKNQISNCMTNLGYPQTNY